MSGGRWGSAGPPPEAYSRVTDADRFRPLHGLILDLLAKLEADFDIERAEGYGLDVELEAGVAARPSVRVAPTDSAAAPIVVVFSSFPGLTVRYGRLTMQSFPSCGCDACDETADSAWERLNEQIDSIVAGGFREEIALPFFGMAACRWEFRSPRGFSSGGWPLDRSHARALIGSGAKSICWQRWSRR